jgi:hypothetical protein
MKIYAKLAIINGYIKLALLAFVWVMIIPLEAERVPHNERVLPS